MLTCFENFFVFFQIQNSRHRPDFSQYPFELAKQKAPTLLRLMPFGLLTILFYSIFLLMLSPLTEFSDAIIIP